MRSSPLGLASSRAAFWPGRILVLGAVFLGPTDAAADVYKYTRPDGTVVYTDNLSQLPKARRAHYNRLRAEREAKRRRLERSVGKEKLARQEAKKKKEALKKAKMSEAERLRKMRELDKLLASLRAKRKIKEEERSEWQKRMKDARARLKERMDTFKKKQEKYKRLATAVGYALLPGQAEEKEKLKKELKALEGEIDALIEETEVTIPEEARKAGVPPGWIR